MIDAKIDSGIDTAMMQVLRQLPRNSSINMAVRAAAINASRTTPLIAPRTKVDWSKSGTTLRSFGSICAAFGSSASSSFTMSKVDAPPFLIIEISTPRWPFCRTILVCGEKPSRTWATSDRYVVAPFRVITGILFRPSTVSGDPLVANTYSVPPILAVPEGKTRFWVLTALTTSVGVKPLASNAAVSRSTEMTRCLPPYGHGRPHPGWSPIAAAEN